MKKHRGARRALIALGILLLALVLAVLAAGCGGKKVEADAAALAENMLALYRMSEAGRAELGRRAFAWYQAHYRRRAVLDALENFIL